MNGRAGRSKIHAAAALAAVGWYLLTPPTARVNDEWIVHTESPLSEWDQHARFNAATACEKELSLYRKQTIEQARALTGEPKQVEKARMFFYVLSNTANCIASDDPRLKEK